MSTDAVLPADAFDSTRYRTIDDSLNGWNVCYHNNSDLVTAWRGDGGAVTEASGYVENESFHASRLRVVTGAVDAGGTPTGRPGPWSRRVQGKVRYQYDAQGAAQLRRDGFTISPNEVT